MLKTETNTPEMEQKTIRAAIRKLQPPHHHLNVTFEHGQWWTACADCGASWSVNDAEYEGNFYFDFEEVDHGDEYCIHEQRRIANERRERN